MWSFLMRSFNEKNYTLCQELSGCEEGRNVSRRRRKKTNSKNWAGGGEEEKMNTVISEDEREREGERKESREGDTENICTEIERDGVAGKKSFFFF